MKYGITTGDLLTYRDNPDVSDVPASFWQGMGSAARDSFEGSFGPLAWKEGRRRYVEGGGDEDSYARDMLLNPSQAGATIGRSFGKPEVPMLSAEEANDRFALGELKFDGPVSLYRAVDLNQRQKDMLRRQDIVRRSQLGFFPQFVAGLGGGALDPVNIAAAFVPGAILARTGLALGSSRAATLGLRAAYGGMEGAMGAAMLAPGTYALSAVEGRPYTVADALIDVAFGTALGAGLHAGIGSFQNWRQNKGKMPPISQAVENSTYETKVQLARGAVSDMVEGRPVNVAPVIDEIVAYHGSPHQFDAFSMEHIGKGEGAQAYGYGLYFAEKEGVARSYRDALAGGRRGSDAPTFVSLNGKPKAIGPDTAHDIAEGGMGTLNRRLNEVEQTIQDYLDKIKSAPNKSDLDAIKQDLPYWVRERDELLRLKESGDLSVREGQMYQVRIRADRDKMLDWDKPLSEQPKAVRDALQKAWLAHPDTDANRTGAEIYNSLLRAEFGNTASPEGASRALSEAGIPGIKYLDGGSRGAGEGSRNFVLFDDKLVDITARNGQPLDLKNARAEIARSKLAPWTDPEFKLASEQATEAIEAAEAPIKARSDEQGIGSDVPEIREMDRIIEQTDQELSAMEQLGTLNEADKASLKEADEMVAEAEKRGKVRDLAAICLSGAGA